MSYRTGEDLLADARLRITEIAPAEAAAERERNVVYLDVRERTEWNLGRIPGALFLPRGLLESKIEQLVPRDRRVVVYCARGNRSALAAETLRQMGYEDVASMSGGFAQWVMEEREVES